jgi:L1 cell adhesion molecule like protein
MTANNNKLGQFELSGIPPAPRGVPQIEVTYSIDADGLLDISAVEKGTGQSQAIKITNDSSRLSEADIARMVDDAEKFAEEDKHAAEKVQAKNALESYAYSMKQTVDDKETGSKLSAEDKELVESKISEVIGWLDSNLTAEKDEFEHQKKELEGICNPIMTKLHQGAAAGAAGVPNAPTAGGATVEEVD